MIRAHEGTIVEDGELLSWTYKRKLGGLREEMDLVRDNCEVRWIPILWWEPSFREKSTTFSPFGIKEHHPGSRSISSLSSDLTGFSPCCWELGSNPTGTRLGSAHGSIQLVARQL